ncbi:F-box/WD repeat-containing protein 7 [Scaptodrosophila lebanonensis]|uniref:F-box/WD repeat-containing protein 7 n=1 Tax=Drosophila lebanonensis TaxID=7225 RepID=A0A6J2TYA9_DROLE|nr:F-box/WD repeat-containing protein 7 [Scaptodrosophila lebanonensis]
MEKGCSVASSVSTIGIPQVVQEGGSSRRDFRQIELKTQLEPTTSEVVGSMSKLREDVEDLVSSNSQHGFAVVLDDESSTSGVLETFEISSSNSLPISTAGASTVGVVAVDDSSSTDTLNGQMESASDHSVSSINNAFFNDPPVVSLLNDDEDDDDEDIVEDEEDEDVVAVVNGQTINSAEDCANTSQMALTDGTVNAIIMTTDGSKIYLETPVVEDVQAHPNSTGTNAVQSEFGEKTGNPKRLSDEFMFGEDHAEEYATATQGLSTICSSEATTTRGIKSEQASDISGADDTDSGSSGNAEVESSLHDRLMSVRLKQMSLTTNASALPAQDGVVCVEAPVSSSHAPPMSKADIESMDLIERCDFENEQRLTGGIVLKTSSVMSKNKLNLSLIKSCMDNSKPRACAGGGASGVSSSSDDWPSSSSSSGRAVSSDSKCTYKDLSTTPTSSRKYSNNRLSKSTAKLNLGASLCGAASCSQHNATTLSSPFFKSSVIIEATTTATSPTKCTGAARTDAFTSTNCDDNLLSAPAPSQGKESSLEQEHKDVAAALVQSTAFNSVASQTSQEVTCGRPTNGSDPACAGVLDDAQPSTSSARCQYATAAKSTRQVNASAQTNERFLSRASAACGNSNNNNITARQRQRTQSQRNCSSNDVIVLEVVVEEGNGNGGNGPINAEAVVDPADFNVDEPWANCDEDNNSSDMEEVCTCQNNAIGNSSLSGSNASLSETLDMDAGESYLGDEQGVTDCSLASAGTVASANNAQQRKRKYNDGRLLDSDYSVQLTYGGSAATGDNNCRKRIAYDFASTPRSSQHASSVLPVTASITPSTAATFGCGVAAVINSPLGRRTPRSFITTRDNPPPELQPWLAQFQRWTHGERLLAVDRLIEHCDPSQVRHMMKVIEPQFQRDFISLLPRELALFVLSYLEPKDLLRAAQTCRSWRFLCDDNLLWKEKCRKAQILTEPRSDRPKRGRDGNMPPISSPWKAAYMRQHIIEMNWRSRAVRKPKVLKGHDDHVITCLQFSANRIVSGSDDNTLKVWSAVTGKCLRTLVGHTGGVWSSQMSDNIIISGSTDRTLKVWDMERGTCVHTLQGHTSTVRCMHLHGNKVVSGSRDATLRVWDIELGTCLHVLVGHLAAVRCVQYDGKLIVSGAYDYMVKIWHPERQECLHTLQGHTNRVYSLQFDGIHVVSGSLDTSIRVWDVETGNCKHTLMGHQSLTSGMELRQNILVSGNADSTVKVWDITTGQCLQTLSGPNKHQSAVTCLQFNSRFVVTSSDDGTVKLWDVKTGEFIRNLVALDSGGSGGVVWRIRANDTKLICAVGSRNGTEETKLMVLDFDVEGACVKCS